MKTKHLLLIIFLFKFVTAFPQTQGIVLTILEDSVVAQVKNNKIEAIAVNIRLENNTDDTIVFRKHTDIVELMTGGKYIKKFCELSEEWGYFKRFVFNKDNENLEYSYFFPMHYHIYFKKSGKPKHLVISGNDTRRISLQRYIKDKKDLRLYRARYSRESLNPNESLMYKINIFLGNYKFEKNQIYYLNIIYSNNQTGNLSSICMESNKIKIVAK